MGSIRTSDARCVRAWIVSVTFQPAALTRPTLMRIGPCWLMAEQRGLVPALVETPEHGKWPYGHIEWCPRDQQGWGCLFEPLSACDAFAQRRVNQQREGENDTAQLGGEGADGGQRVYSRADGIPKAALQAPEGMSGSVLGVRTHGSLWWRAQLVARIARPSAKLGALLRQLRNALGLRSGYISAHVRMGDSCTHPARFSAAGPGAPSTAGCVPVGEYLAATERLAQAYGVYHVFLASDDAEAVKAFKASKVLTDVWHLEMDRSGLFNSSWLIEHRMAAQVLDAASGTSLHTVRLLNLSCRSFHRISIALQCTNLSVLL